MHILIAQLSLGVFAVEAIQQGALVEEAHCIQLSKQEYQDHGRSADSLIQGTMQNVHQVYTPSQQSLQDLRHDLAVQLLTACSVLQAYNF